MKYSKKRDNKKPIAVALGVLLALAPGAVIIDNINPVFVYAMTDEEFEQSVLFQDWLGDRIADIGDHWTRYLFTSNDPELATLATVAYAVSCQNSWYLKLRNAVSAEVEINSQGAVYAGYYRIEEGGQIYPSYIAMPQGVSVAGTPIAYGYHFNVVMSGEITYPQNSGGSPYFESYIENNAIRYRSRTLSESNYTFRWWDSDGYLSGTGGTTLLSNNNKILFSAFTSANIPVVSGSISVSSKTLSGSGAIPNLPDLGVPMTYAEPWEYYNALVDYLNDNYDLPDGIVGEPYDPYTPEYPDPSDAYPGIPKEWTIENPQLPTSPSIGLNAYKPDLSEMNPSESIMEYDTGFDFWWWLTNQALTHTNTKTIVLLAILLGLVGYLLWHLGGHL